MIVALAGGTGVQLARTTGPDHADDPAVTASPRSAVPDPTLVPPSAPRRSGGPAARPSPTPAPRSTPARRSPSPRPAPTHTFPVPGCATSYAATHHDYPAADIFAARGCPFVAPVAGVVDEVSVTDEWTSSASPGETRGGRSVSVVGVDGVRYYGSHLEAVAPGIRPGVAVAAGEVLGRIGDSGSARGTGTHLHFGLSWPTPTGRWWIRRGVVAPQPYLDAWRAGRDLSPAGEVGAARRRLGADTPCTSYC